MSVTISTTTPNATIFYTTDGTNPTTASVVYSTPLTLTQTTRIRAMAAAPGFLNSEVSEATFTINNPPGTTAAPQPNPLPGTFNNPVEVGLTTTTNPATICYTLDGSDPTCSNGVCTGTSATYSGGTRLRFDAPTGGGSVTLKALACSAGNTNSEITSHTYSFQAGPVVATPAPTGTPVPYNTQVLLSTSTVIEGPIQPVVCYTTNATAPSCTPDGTGCLTGTAIPQGSGTTVSITQNVTFRAIACRQNYAPSEERTYSYLVQLPTPDWQSDTPGTYNNDVTAGAVPGTLVTATPVPTGQTLCYTTGTTEPTCSTAGTCATGSPDAPLVTTTNTTVRVRACHPNYEPSAELSGVFNLQVAPVAITPFTCGPSSPAGCNETNAGNHWDGGNDVDFNLTSATKGSNGNPAFIVWTVDGDAPTCPAAPSPPDFVGGDNVTPSGQTGDLDAATFPHTIQAIACKAGYAPSPLRVLRFSDPASEVILNPVPEPFVSDSPIPIILTSEPDDATICYTLGQNPDDPDCNHINGQCVGATEYDRNSPPSVTETGSILKAIACKTGVPLKSQIVSATYTLRLGQVSAWQAGPDGQFDNGTDDDVPAVSPIGHGTRIYLKSTSTKQVGTPANSGSFECPADRICFFYRTDGTNPTCAGSANLRYDPSQGITHAPTNTTPVTYRVITCDGDKEFEPSAIQEFTFGTFLVAPTITPNGNILGPYSNEQDITLASPSVAGPNVLDRGYFCYSMNGDVPACVGGGACGGGAGVQQVTAANIDEFGTSTSTITVTRDNTVVRAVACRNNFPASALTTSNQFDLHVADPTVSVASGSYGAPINVTVTNGATPNAKVCWAIDQTINDSCGDLSGTQGTDWDCDTVGADAPLTGHQPPANLSTNVTLHVRACRADFLPTADLAFTYQFTPYPGTRTIDGNIIDWLPENNIPHEQNNGGPQRSMLSWDATNIYVAWAGHQLDTFSGRKFHFYIRGGSGPYTTTIDDSQGAGFFGDDAPAMDPLVPGGVNFHFWVLTNRTGQGASRWNGAAWEDASGSLTLTCATGGTLGAASAFVECSVPRAQLGLADTNAVMAITGGLYTSPNLPLEVRNWFPWDGGRRYWMGNLGTNIPGDPALILTP